MPCFRLGAFLMHYKKEGRMFIYFPGYLLIKLILRCVNIFRSLFFITNPIGTLGNQSFSHILCRHGRIKKKCFLYFVFKAYRSTFVTWETQATEASTLKLKAVPIVLCFNNCANYLIMQIVMLTIWTKTVWKSSIGCFVPESCMGEGTIPYTLLFFVSSSSVFN